MELPRLVVVVVVAAAGFASSACSSGNSDAMSTDDAMGADATDDVASGTSDDGAVLDGADVLDLEGAIVDAEPNEIGDDTAEPIDPDSGALDAANDAPPSCDPQWVGKTQWTCSADGNARGQCVGGVQSVEACARGCLRVTPPVCMGTTATWSCTGTYGTTKAKNGDYYLTAFGCWKDATGGVHTDPGDNCIPGCLAKAKSVGLCHASDTGPQCEERVNYYVADSARFGCAQRVRVINPANGKKVIAAVLDAGPACWVEAKVSKALLDASAPVNLYLFGTTNGYADRALVHVVEVDDTLPLGPEK